MQRLLGSILEACARHRGVVLLLYAMLALLAVRSARQVPLDAIPDLSDPQVIVFTEWRGRSPTLVEDQITYPISSALLAAPQVQAVRGYSMFGMSFVHVLFAEDVDVYWARSRVQEYLGTIQARLPEGATATLGPDATGIGWVYEYALVDRSGKHDLAELRALQDFSLRFALESVPGVAQVASVGGFEKQYQVQLDPDRLRAFNVSTREVADAVRRGNAEVGGRVLEIGGREAFVRGRGYLRGEADLADLVVKTNASGTPVRVSDVGTVRLGPELRRGLAELNGEGEAVGAIVIARHNTHALDVIERVKTRLATISAGLPAGVEVVPTYDRSALIHRAVDTLQTALIEEGIVVALVIILFLLHLRSALLPILSLPLAVLLAFIPMAWLGIPATIMSLGGIAIAVGATVDAEIVMIEACHKRLEHAPPDLSARERRKLLGEAAREVTPAIFFSLLIVAVAFIPVFGLEGQAGRLFKPLAYTKTFVMLAAALLSVTFAPALRDLLIRGKIRREADHPVSRFIRAAYEPFVYIALRRPITTLAIGGLAVLSAIPVAMRLGNEFMPALNEGDILYMPTTLPGLSIEEAKRQLARQDAILAGFPEVATVFGKVGRAETPTDPAPLSMVETVVQLKPQDQWPTVHEPRWHSSWAPRWLGLHHIWPETRRENWDELVAKLGASLQQPGWTGAYTMPIRARIDMLSTGVRTPVGVKVFGPDLASIERSGLALERLLRDLPGTRSILYERSLGGVYVDIIPRRDALARHGLRPQDLTDLVELAVGGETITTTVEGRRRFSVQLRLVEDARSSPERLRELPVPLPGPSSPGTTNPGALSRTVPLGELAEVVLADGPPMLRSEAGLLVGYVYVDLEPWKDLGGYVDDARAKVDAAIARGELPLGPGMYLRWTGQYEELAAMQARMRLLLPLTLLLVALLLYLQFRNLTEVLIVLLSVPFALVGSVWMLHILDYRLSTAVFVGLIALVGLAAQTGVVMIVYIDHAFERRLRAGKIRDRSDIVWAHMEGTVLRVRPKLMTVATMLIGLTPLLWATGSGADVMKRIAAPMIGGLLSSAFLTLELIPVVYTYWRAAQLRKSQRTGRPLAEICGLDR
ncbi:MAG: efflux RND transporter permease subunit [Nannocystis sp.]|uniref:efflux RND transporter permease subunit n=1 Tax=Nannocystis sp. TaxID=1962667 RepID=UPI002427D1D5|nr:efflux RND transporter permease subunit [Nannocystis sp.]MBK9752704.1 efflux RND transporter permease subunit [Nannocystis sp.]